MNKSNIFQDLKDIAVELEIMEKDIAEGTVTNLQISNALNNLRMVLEHAVYDAAVIYGYNYNSKGKKRNIYFPYSTEPDKFDKAVGRSGLSDLKTDNFELLNLIENQQPYKCKSTWLVDLSNLSNGSKHQGHRGWYSTPSGFCLGGEFFIDDKSKNVLITGASVNGVRLPNVNFINKKNVKLSGSNKNLFQRIGPLTYFRGTRIIIIPFFRHCYLRVQHFIDAYYPVLEK